MIMDKRPFQYRFRDRVFYVSSGCLEWFGGRTLSGYGRISIRGKNKRVHRVAWELSRGPIPDGLVVCHKCDNKLCCNIEHLFVGTSQDNVADRDAKGRQSRGEKVKHHKLTSAMVIEIRRLRAAGAGTYKEIGARFGIKKETVWKIVRGESWAHVGMEKCP